MADSTDRPQDVGRRHRRKGEPSGATSTLLARYQGAMRDELGALLDELKPTPPAPGLGLVPTEQKRLSIADRSRRWDLAIKIGRELAAEIDPPAPAEGVAGDPAAPAKPRRRGRIDYGG